MLVLTHSQPRGLDMRKTSLIGTSAVPSFLIFIGKDLSLSVINVLYDLNNKINLYIKKYN